MRNTRNFNSLSGARLLLLCSLSLFRFFTLSAQGGTEIYLVSLSIQENSLSFGEAINITQNPGYDNQPYFPDDDHLVYARTRNGQTDIALLDLRNEELTWQTDTPGGSEYSPAPVPGKAE